MNELLFSILTVTKYFFKQFLFEVFIVASLIICVCFLFLLIFHFDIEIEFLGVYILLPFFAFIFYYSFFNIVGLIIGYINHINLILSKIVIETNEIADHEMKSNVGDKFYLYDEKFHSEITFKFYHYFSFKNFEKNLFFNYTNKYLEKLDRQFTVAAEITQITDNKIIFKFKLFENKVLNFYVNGITKVSKESSCEINITLKDDIDLNNYNITTNINIIKDYWNVNWSFNYQNSYLFRILNKSKIKRMLVNSFPFEKNVFEKRDNFNGCFPFNLEPKLLIEINSNELSIKKEINYNKTIIGLILLNEDLKVIITNKSQIMSFKKGEMDKDYNYCIKIMSPSQLVF